jgi:hypothetical protein
VYFVQIQIWVFAGVIYEGFSVSLCVFVYGVHYSYLKYA